MNGKIIEEIVLPSPSKTLKLSMITYYSRNLKVKGYLVEPLLPGNYSGILYLRGGIRHVGMVRVSRITQYASEGYVVFAPVYRGNLGGEGEEDFGGEDREDALSAYDILLNRENVCSSNIHVIGFSRGGMMGAMVAKERTPTSMVTWGGVSDLTLTYKERPDLRKMLRRVIGGSPDEKEEIYLDRSPIQMVSSIHCPVLIVHGERDTSVSVKHAYLLESELKRQNKEVESWIYGELGHTLTVRKQLMLTRKVTAWLKEKE
ncbi:prolyl oligopeptidase family serine peptidase [Evansella sp. AB-P1]|uniref:alpha/beta hydrolase family protein n=1 Tax=Evansella sp. AB-P1 TaxID=3037653 RepID=UPI00241DA890|nr:prolyl oligopeptidase family serine peptidase [Evansella sp. AB-P1]MDG5787766.1 prolyl oligopeptidase family serine peptidase [Evansella sp. AB-P1]